MKIKFRYIIFFVMCIAVVTRIAYVNLFYDKPVSYSNELGEKFAYGEQFEVSVDSIDTFSKDEWHEKLKNDNVQMQDVAKDFIVILAECTVKNTGETEAKFDNSCVYAQISSARNGGYMYAGNEKQVTPVYSPGQEKVIKMMYIIDKMGIAEKNILSEKAKVKVCEYSAIHTISQ